MPCLVCGFNRRLHDAQTLSATASKFYPPWYRQLQKIVDPRLLAVRCVVGVIDGGRSLSRLLPDVLRDVSDARQRALVQEFSFGVIRWYPRLNNLAGCLLERPLRNKDRDLYMLILLGLYQLGYLKVSEHAAVNETVECARRLGKVWAVKLINGVLRNYQRKKSDLDKKLDESPESRFAHPAWLLEQLQKDWPEQWESIAVANNSRAPMTLRVNTLKQNRDQYQRALAEQGIQSEVVPHTAYGLNLQRAVAVEQLPGFAQGHVSVQDGAAQLAQELLCVEPGMRVLDACAAPGGKTAQLLEAAKGTLELTALDIDAKRLQRIEENLGRLGLSARLIVADAGDPESWWDGKPFDRILLDAPCSATGVIRRHPDIKMLRREEDIVALGQLQLRLLGALWPLLASHGKLLYATCSVFCQENSDSVQKFLTTTPDAIEQAICKPWGHPGKSGRQILPGEDNMDGFYYACLARSGNVTSDPV